jgi:hypothetical protein
MMAPKGLTQGRAALGRIVAPVLLAAALSLAAVPAPAAPIGWNAFGGWYTDQSDFFAGAGARIGLGTIHFNPNAEYITASSGSRYTINLDGNMTVMPLAVGSIWAGGGVTFYTVNPEHGSSDTKTGVNVLAGAGLNAIPLKPYAQAKVLFVNGDNPLSFCFGVRF